MTVNDEEPHSGLTAYRQEMDRCEALGVCQTCKRQFGEQTSLDTEAKVKRTESFLFKVQALELDEDGYFVKGLRAALWPNAYNVADALQATSGGAKADALCAAEAAIARVRALVTHFSSVCDPTGSQVLQAVINVLEKTDRDATTRVVNPSPDNTRGKLTSKTLLR